MEFVFRPKSARDLKRLSPEIRQRIIEKLEYFAAQKSIESFSTPLTSIEIGQRRFRIGDYRVVFDIEENKLIILRVGHRKDIYK